jgi:hypothetical protein
VRSATPAQLVNELGPFAIEHSLESLFGHIARTGTVQVVAGFFVIDRDRFGNCPGSSPDNQEPSCDLLAGINFSERAVASRVEIEG